MDASAAPDPQNDFLPERSIHLARLRLLRFASTHTLDELLEATLDEAEALSDSLIGFYHFLEPDQRTLSLQNWSTRTKSMFCKAAGKGSHYDLGAAGVWVDCIHRRRPVIHNDYAALPHRKGLPPGHAPVVRELVVPVFRNEKIVAILGVGNKPDDYTLQDVECISLLADLAWDITQHKRSEEALHRLNRELRALSDCNQVLIRAEDEQALLEDVCRIICDRAGYRMAWVGYAEDDEARTIRPVARAGFDEGYLEEAGFTWAESERGCGPSGIAIRTGNIDGIQDFAIDPKAAPWRVGALARGYRAIIALPLKDAKSVPFGVLNIYSTEPDAFTVEEIRLLEELAGDLAFGIVVLRARRARIEVEEQLRETGRKLEEAERIAHVGYVDRDYETGRVALSDETCRIFNLPPGDRVFALDAWHDRWLGLIHPEDRERTARAFVEALRGEARYDVEYRVPQADGEVRFVHNVAVVTRDGAGRPRRWFGTMQDVTEQKSAEAALQEREAFIRKILESVDEGFIVIDREYRMLSANKSFCDFAGMPESLIVGRPCYEVVGRQDKPCFETGSYCAVRRTFETGLPDATMRAHTDGAGAIHSLEIKSYPILDGSGQVWSVIQTLNDVTEKRKLEEQLRHAQKLEALGTLAGGVAHDFNNILSVIAGYGSLMKKKVPPGDPCMQFLTEILEASDRAAQLTKSLLLFSRKQVPELKPVRINELVSGMKKMVVRIIGEDIETHLALSSGSPVVIGDRGQLEQVLMNFAANARDAMPDGGALLIETAAADMDEDFVRSHGFGIPGRYARISVSDTGSGMDETTRERVFEPFFTTKGIGKGTGLGLSIVYGIVSQHNGYVECSSRPGRGTVFTVWLPIIPGGSAEAEPEELSPVRGGTETILVADDDEGIRKLVKHILEESGYTVLTAKDGAEAVEQFAGHRDRVGLVLLDVIMPRKSGREAFDEITGLRPGVKTLFFSGYSEDVVQKKRIIEEGLPYLSKPATPRALLSKVREILDRDAAP